MTCVMIKTVLYTLFINNVYSAKILAVIPSPSISHQIVFRPLTQELARRGHQVVVITTDPVFQNGQTPDNFTEIDVHDVTYNAWNEVLQLPVEYGRADSMFEQIRMMNKIYPEFTELQLKQNDVQALLRENKFDLLLLEACTKSALIYSHLVKAPIIQISSMGMTIGNDFTVGATVHPLLYPTAFSQRLYNHTFLDKLNELYIHWWLDQIYDDHGENMMFQRVLGSSAPMFRELIQNIDMLFLNTHPLWSNNQPWPPNVVSLWGIYKKPTQELDQDIKNYLDSSKHGVIYFSLGTNVLPSMLPQRTIEMFNNVFAKLPYDVLWRWDRDEMPGKAPNIRLFKWLPQSDILKHPKIKLFITQGGLQSTDDAINAEVPLIGIPIIADQWYNTEKFKLYNIGLKLELPDLTEEKLLGAIERVVHDSSFKFNIAKLRAMMNDQPQSALDRAVWWTEYVLRHGGAKHLRTRAANMPWTQYYEIESVLTVVIIVLTSLTLAIVVIYSVLNRVANITLSKKIK